jgi:tetratricopeptide (TPR) repeat protein
MGASYDHFGAYAEAEAQFRAGVAAFAGAHRSEEPEAVDALLQLAETLTDMERLAEADSAAQAAEAAARTTGDPLWVSRAHHRRSEVLRRAGDLTTAQSELESALAALDSSREGFKDDAGAIANALALVYKDQGRLDVAERMMRQALEHTRDFFGDGHSKTDQAWTNLAYILVAQERPEEALGCTRQALMAAQSARGLHRGVR